MGYRRWLQLLVLALVVDLLVRAWFQAEPLYGPLQGDRGASTVLAVLWWLGPGLAVAAVVGTARAWGRTHAELHRSRQALAADAGATHDWVWETDAEHRLTYCSPAVETLLGYRPEDLLGTRSTELLADDAERDQALAATRSATRSRSGWSKTRSCWLHRDGHRLALEGQGTALLDERGRLVGFRGTRRAVDATTTGSADLAAARSRVEALMDSADFDVALQPIVSLAAGTVSGFEALARFHDGRGPDSWFADAEAAGLSIELEQLTFTAATALLRRLPETTYLSVNAGPDLVMAPEFTRGLLDSRVPLDRLVVEITEHARVADYAALNEAITSLRRHGVRFAIDDTGAGYASLRHIIELRPDIIKLDRMFLSGLDADPARRSLITALVLLALDIGASITGEGVETKAQLGALNLLAVDNVQGYFLGRPSTHPEQWREWAHTRWPVDQALNDQLTGPPDS